MATMAHPISSREPAFVLPAPPWARVRRLPLLCREVTERLAPGALEVLWAAAEVIVEGSEELSTTDGMSRPSASNVVYASVMVTLDLGRLGSAIEEPADEFTAMRLADLLAEHPPLRARLEAVVREWLHAGSEARGGAATWRLVRDPVPTLAQTRSEPEIDVRLEIGVRATDCKVWIDADAVIQTSEPPSGHLRRGA